MPPLTVMIKPASSLCNMACRYCFYLDEASHRWEDAPKLMSMETMEKLVRKSMAYADGTVSFAFQGGEPTLEGLDYFRRFTAMVQSYNARRLPVHYAIQTNGLSLDREWAAFFAEHRFLVGVSLDGRQAEHDLYRVDRQGLGTYERVKNNLALLREAQVDFNILTVVTKAVAEHPGEVFQALRPYKFMQFIPCLDPMDGSTHAYSITGAEYGQFLAKLFALYEEAYFSQNPVSIRTFDNYVQMMMGYPPEHCGMAGVCGPFYAVEADGSVYPCDFYMLDEWRLGNIRETTFSRLDKLPLRQAFLAASHPLPEECQSCSYLPLCHNGCKRDRQSPFADIPGQNRLCEGYKLFFEACQPGLARIAAAEDKRARKNP